MLWLTPSLIAIKLACPTNPRENTVVRAAAPARARVEACGSVRILGTCPVPAAGQSTITALYTARFGVPPVPSKIFVQCNQFVDGFQSYPATFSAIVPTAT